MGVPSVGAQGGLPLLGPTAVKRQNYKLHRIDPGGPVGPALRSLCGGRLPAAWEPLREAEHTQYCCLLHRRSGNEVAAEGLRGAPMLQWPKGRVPGTVSGSPWH